VKPYTVADREQDLDDALAREDWRAVEDLADQLDQLCKPHTPSLLGAALWYAEQELPVFPIMPLTKKPYPKTRGLKDASTNTADVRRWWDEHPTANIGIATGHRFDVVDFDGLQAHVTWGKTFGAGWAGLTILATVSTPRPGGLHLWVPAAPGRGNRAKMMPGVDYRGKGGYVLAPPSVLDGRSDQYAGTYRFLRKLDPDTWRTT
jgi:hypothetical protein